MKKLIHSKNRLTSIIFSILLLSLIVSCSKPMENSTATGSTTGTTTGSKGTSVGPRTNEVWIQSMAFNPATISVAAGTAITWTNKDAVAHTVTSDAGLFDSGQIGANGTNSLTFPTTGTFKYHCAIHPSMVATVVVN